MFEIYRFNELEILAFILLLVRISVFFAVWPVFGLNHVPHHTKILLSLLVAFILFPIIGWQSLSKDIVSDLYILLIIKEAFIGVLIGYLARGFFYSLEVCGHLMSDALGLSSAQILNPASDTRSTILEQFYIILVTLFFLTINGHHYFIQSLVKSYEIIPLATVGLSLNPLAHFGEFAQDIMLIGLKFSAPVIASIFAMNIAMGIVGRAVPQMNVLITSLSVNILFGLFVMIFSMPMMLDSLPGVLNQTLERLFLVLRAL